MRDDHRIRERSAWGDAYARFGGWLRAALLVAVAGAAARWGLPAWLGPTPRADDAHAGVPPSTEEATAPAADGDAVAAAAAKPNIICPRASPNGVPEANRAGATAPPPRCLPPAIAPSAGKPEDAVARLSDGLLPLQTGVAMAGEYTAQISTFAARDEARAFCRQLGRRGFHPHVACSGQACWVRLGRFAQREQAEEYRQRLARSDIAARIVQVR